MKKIRVIFGILIICMYTCGINTFASTKIYTRTEQNYLVPSDVRISESNKWNILNTPAIDSSEKIYDFGQLLSESEEQKLFNKVVNFIDETNFDCVIVTIGDHPKTSSKDYAHDFYDYNNFGDSGVLFLIDMKYNGIYMVTKGNAVNLFPDDRMNPILKNVYSKVVVKDYYGACNAFIISISGFVNVGIADDDEIVEILEDGDISVSKDLHFREALIFSLFGTMIIMAIVLLSDQMISYKDRTSKVFLNKQTMKIIDINERFLGTQTTKNPINNKKSKRD